ncbi:MAG: hypothetical protein U9Q98_02415 [Bacteroidota bacterium]|nr:hypothetical protein [Bacteroidota bacterium]
MKKFTLLSLTASLMVFLSCNLQAQDQSNQNTEEDNETTVDMKHGIGAAAGFTTGYGLSYRYYMEHLRFQLTFSPFVRSKDDMEFSTGLTVMYNIVETKHINLFLYESNHWKYDKYNYYNNIYDYDTGDYNSEYVENIENFVNIGIGFGFEVLFWERLSANLMLGYGALENFEIVQPTVEGGLFYRF